MAESRDFTIYISSTFSDLDAERRIAKDIASAYGRVLESRRADDEGVIDVCIADVHACSVYVGIVGARYGFKPPGDANPQGKSITELEYDACEKASSGRQIPRLMFKKTEGFTEEQLKDPDVPRILAFRDKVGGPQTAFPFPQKDISFELALDRALRKAEARFNAVEHGYGGAMGGAAARKDLLHQVALVGVRGTDDAVLDAVGAAGDGRFLNGSVGPSDPQWLAPFDAIVRAAQVACLLVTPKGLQRLCEAPGDGVARVTAALNVGLRRGRPLMLALAGVAREKLPAAWAEAAVCILPAPEQWVAPATMAVLGELHRQIVAHPWPAPPSGDAVLDALRAELHAVQGDVGPLPRLALPIIVVAATRAEMSLLVDANRQAFESFDAPDRKRRVSDFKKMSKQWLRPGQQWPDADYFEQRILWRCLRLGNPVLRVLLDTVDAINRAEEGTRERRLLPRIQIVPRLYDLDELLNDRFGSAAALLSAAGAGSLVVIDEFALLHPRLRSAAQRLVDLKRTAVVSISASDPAHTTTRELLGDSSFLHIGSLLSRFKAAFDLRCEVAVNSEARLQRWLRLAIPDLLAAGDAAEAVPELVGKAAAILGPTRGQA